MNKTELIESIGGRLGDRKAATAALDAVLTEIQNAVTKGDKVSIVGFGVFERRERAARTARNPRTGEAVKVKKTAVPAFRPGAGFKELVAVGRVPKATSAAKSAPAAKTVVPAARTAARTAAKPAAAPARKVTAAKTTVAATKKAAPAAKSAPATKSTAAAKSAPAKKAPASTTSRRAVTATKATRKAGK
jgi:DNA-binding protein HU-beta